MAHARCLLKLSRLFFGTYLTGWRGTSVWRNYFKCDRSAGVTLKHAGKMEQAKSMLMNGFYQFVPIKRSPCCLNCWHTVPPPPPRRPHKAHSTREWMNEYSNMRATANYCCTTRENPNICIADSVTRSVAQLVKQADTDTTAGRLNHWSCCRARERASTFYVMWLSSGIFAVCVWPVLGRLRRMDTRLYWLAHQQSLQLIDGLMLDRLAVDLAYLVAHVERGLPMDHAAVHDARDQAATVLGDFQRDALWWRECKVKADVVLGAYLNLFEDL